MDPDAALAELLDVARAHTAELDDEATNNHADTGRMADLVLALHGWLETGGMLPAAWHLATCMAHDCRDGAPELERTVEERKLLASGVILSGDAQGWPNARVQTRTVVTTPWRDVPGTGGSAAEHGAE